MVRTHGKSIARFDGGIDGPRHQTNSHIAQEPVSHKQVAQRKIGEQVLAVRNLKRAPLVNDVSLEVYSGEVLGIAGLVGSGRSELLRAIFGADPATSGSIQVGNQIIRSPFQNPSQAVNNGLAMITEDRKANGLLLSQSIMDNVVLASLHSRESVLAESTKPAQRIRNRIGVYFDRAARKAVEYYAKRLDVRSVGIEQHVSKLSGGNQQKVVLAKWLYRDAKIYLFDEPTRGIDVAARNLVYEVIEELRSAGKAVLLVSSDLEEFARVSTRIGVLSNGRWVGEFAQGEFDREAINTAMFAGYIHSVGNPK